MKRIFCLFKNYFAIIFSRNFDKDDKIDIGLNKYSIRGHNNYPTPEKKSPEVFQAVLVFVGL